MEDLAIHSAGELRYFDSGELFFVRLFGELFYMISLPRYFQISTL